MEPNDLTDDGKPSIQRMKEPLCPEATAIQALAELFANLKSHRHYCRYMLERMDGELVFRQPNIDAMIEKAIAEVFGVVGKDPGRRIIRLP